VRESSFRYITLFCKNKRLYKPKTGKHYFSIKITSTSQSSSYIFFGISTFVENAECVGFSEKSYTYCLGYRWHQDKNNSLNISYGRYANAGDTIGFELDTDKWELYFCHNEVNLGIAYDSKSLTPGDYFVVIHLDSIGDGVEVINPKRQIFQPKNAITAIKK